MSAALCFTACVAYFAMGSNLGWTPIDVEWQRSDGGVQGVNRKIFYARYIDWYDLLVGCETCYPIAKDF